MTLYTTPQGITDDYELSLFRNEFDHTKIGIIECFISTKCEFQGSNPEIEFNNDNHTVKITFYNHDGSKNESYEIDYETEDQPFDDEGNIFIETAVTALYVGKNKIPNSFSLWTEIAERINWDITDNGWPKKD